MSVTTRITDDDVGLGGGQKALLPLGLSPDDVNCPICVETISDPFVTSCGHTFCYQCISTQLKHKNSCPSCGDYLTADNIYPNFLLNKILRKAATAPPSGPTSLVDHVQRLLADNLGPANGGLLGGGPTAAAAATHSTCGGSSPAYGSWRVASAGAGSASGGGGMLGLPGQGGFGCSSGGGGRVRLRLRDIDAVLEALYEAREELERRESSDVLHLLLCFLHHAREHKARQLAELRQQLAILEHDIHAVQSYNAAAPPPASLTAAAAPAAASVSMPPPLPLLPPLLTTPPVAESNRTPAQPTSAAAAAAQPPSYQLTQQPHRPVGPAPGDMPHPVPGSTTGDWLRRALPHLASEADAGTGGPLSAAAAQPPPASPSDPQDPLSQSPAVAAAGAGSEGPEILMVDVAGPGPVSQGTGVLHRGPMRRSSWYLHTFTPAGGISSVTVDTSSLLEPGQQAEAFSAAVQHAMAAAGAASGGSMSAASGGGSGGAVGGTAVAAAAAAARRARRRERRDRGGVEDEDDSQACGMSEGKGRVADTAAGGRPEEVFAVAGPEGGTLAAAVAPAAAAAARPRVGTAMEEDSANAMAASAASAPVTAAESGEPVEAGEPPPAGCTSAAAVAAISAPPPAARRGFPRCGSADNFQLLTRCSAPQQPSHQSQYAQQTQYAQQGHNEGAPCGSPHPSDQQERRTAAPTSAQPSLSGDAGDSGGTAGATGTGTCGGSGAATGGGGGGDDCSVLSGADYPKEKVGSVAAQLHLHPRARVVVAGTAGAAAGSSGVPGQGPSRDAALPCLTAAAAAGAAGVTNGASGIALQQQQYGGAGNVGVAAATAGTPAAAADARPSPRCGGGRTYEYDEEEEDEMDVRERRRRRPAGAATGAAAATAIGQIAGGRVGPPAATIMPLPPQSLPHPGLRYVNPYGSGNAGLSVAAAAAAGAAGPADVPAAAGAAAADEDPDVVQAAKRRRMLSQFDVLERCYLQMRTARPSLSGNSIGAAPAISGATVGGASLHADLATTAATSHATASPLLAPVSSCLAAPPLLAHHAARPVGITPLPLHFIMASQQLQHQHLPFLAGGTAAAGGACGGAHSHRPPSGPDGQCRCEGHGATGGVADVDLSSFGAVLAAATQYSRLEMVAEIPRHGSASGSGSGGLQILSSIEFDLSDNLFATAGVVPRILVYDYQALLAGHQPRPVTELSVRSKLSCLSYSPAVRQHLLAADYLGGVSLWDTEAGMQVQDYEAHERRVWGVDFSPARPHCFASGSDDGMVKIWSTRQPNSCLALELRGNVCSVEFHPSDPNLLAVGSALHCGLLYDIRQPAAPLHTLLGHRKAVSYVRWMTSRPQELVTASTDSTLKLWSLAPTPPPPPPSRMAAGGGRVAAGGRGDAAYLPAFLLSGDEVAGTASGGVFSSSIASASASFRGAELLRTFSGHVNERNFVGLAAGPGDLIACGSEAHEVVVYHRSIPQPALRFGLNSRFSDAALGAGPNGRGPQSASQGGPRGAAAGGGSGAQPHHFVTSLTWRRQSPHLLVANSAGYMWLMGLAL